MSLLLEFSSAAQLYQDFPKVATASIRKCLAKFSYHYVPAHEYLDSLWTEYEAKGTNKCRANIANEIHVTALLTPRKAKAPSDPRTLDTEFRNELGWLRAKIGKRYA